MKSIFELLSLMPDRLRGKAFVPDTATIKQLREVLYWTKSYETEESECGEGLVISFYLKPEYYRAFLKALAEVNGREITENQDLTLSH